MNPMVVMDDQSMATISGIEGLDKDGQDIVDVETGLKIPLPTGTKIEWSTTGPEVVSLEPAEDGLSCGVRSGKVGKATVNYVATTPEGDQAAGAVDFTVKNSGLGTLKATVSDPVREAA